MKKLNKISSLKKMINRRVWLMLGLLFAIFLISIFIMRVKSAKADLLVTTTVDYSLVKDTANNPVTMDEAVLVQFNFVLNNPTTTNYSDLTLDTNLPVSSLHYIQKIVGSTAIDTSGSTLKFRHVNLRSTRAWSGSFQAYMTRSWTTPINIGFTPTLIDSKQAVISNGSQSNIYLSQLILTLPAATGSGILK